MNDDKKLIWEQYRLIYEMPNFKVPSNKGVLKDDEGNKMRDMSVEQLEPNIALFYNPHETWFTPAGFFNLTLTADEDTTKKMLNKEINPIIIPQGAPLGQTPFFAKLWKDKRAKLFLGIVQGEIHDDAIFIDFMTVRSAARRNQINTKMIQVLKKEFPNRKLETSKRTSDGNKFWKSVDDAEKLN